MAAYETAVCASSSSPHQTGRPSRTRTCDLPLIRRMHSPPVLSVGGTPRQNRTRFSALQERRIASNACGAQNLEPAERIERSSVAYHATALPLSYTGLEPKGGFEPPSELYEGSVFPTKLLRQYLWSE